MSAECNAVKDVPLFEKYLMTNGNCRANDAWLTNLIAEIGKSVQTIKESGRVVMKAATDNDIRKRAAANAKNSAS